MLFRWVDCWLLHLVCCGFLYFARWVGGLCLGLGFDILIELSFRVIVVACTCWCCFTLFGFVLMLAFGFGFVWVLLFLMDACYFCLFLICGFFFGFVLTVLDWVWWFRFCVVVWSIWTKYGGI